MNLLRAAHRAVNTYPTRSKQALRSTAVVLALVVSYCITYIEVYYRETRWWDATWSGTHTSDRYIAMMEGIGLPPNWLVPPRPTFWQLEFSTSDWVSYGVLSFLAACVFIMLADATHRVLHDTS